MANFLIRSDRVRDGRPRRPGHRRAGTGSARWIGLVAGAGLTAALAAGPGSTGLDGAPENEVSFHGAANGTIIVPVIARGRAYRFLLDTGSSHTIVTESLAATLGAAVVSRSEIITPGGAAVWPIVELPDLTIGSVRVSSILATRLPDRQQAVLGPGVSGLLGQDLLSRFAYTLDYEASKLVWHDAGDRLPGARLALEPMQGRFVVLLPQEPRCRCSLRLVPDSGATGLVLYDGTTADWLHVREDVGTVRVASLVGRRAARAVVIPDLRVGQFRLWDLPAAWARRTGGDEEGDGLLPLSMFRRVHINSRQHFMTVEPR
ncbi:MAG: aspartyl protease family protein [Vicinamibacterales bacterium]